MKVLEAPITPPSVLIQSIPRDLESICLKCLARQSQHRYASANELVSDLDRFLNSKPVLARPRRWREKAESWLRRNVAAIAVLTALIVSAIPMIIVVLLSNAAATSPAKNAAAINLTFLKELLDDEPRNAAARLRSAKWKLELGRFDECLEDTAIAQDVGGNDGMEIALIQCKALMGKRRWKDALENAQKALSHNEYNAEAHFLVGKIHFAMGDNQSSASSLTKAIGIQPDYADAYEVRAGAYGALNDREAERRDRAAVLKLRGAKSANFDYLK